MSELGQKIDHANSQAVERLITSMPVLKDIRRAREVIPLLEGRALLHAGPPVEWDAMCGPMKGAVIGAILYEGWAHNEDDAVKLATEGQVAFSPAHHHGAVGPMAGVVSPSMFVFCVENETFGNTAYCTLNEGLGKVLRFGAYGREVLARLKWMEEVLAPTLRKAILSSKGINIKNIIVQALTMGDECHNRNVAGTLLFLKEILPYLLKSGATVGVIREVTDFISGNVHFFLNLSMPACKATADAILGFPDSTLVSAMARNGTEIGIRVAGLGERWFTAPSGTVKGLFFSGFSQEDANPDLGDSTITEVGGIGGVAMAAAPAITRFVGGSPDDAIRFTREMAEICIAHHRDFLIPSLNFTGTPVGIDIRKVIETNITPVINTGIAHKQPGIGQIGAGLLRAPIEPFEEALRAFAAQAEVS